MLTGQRYVSPTLVSNFVLMIKSKAKSLELLGDHAMAKDLYNQAKSLA
jgi:hypothetical protein